MKKATRYKLLLGGLVVDNEVGNYVYHHDYNKVEQQRDELLEACNKLVEWDKTKYGHTQGDSMKDCPLCQVLAKVKQAIKNAKA